MRRDKSSAFLRPVPRAREIIVKSLRDDRLASARIKGISLSSNVSGPEHVLIGFLRTEWVMVVII